MCRLANKRIGQIFVRSRSWVKDSNEHIYVHIQVRVRGRDCVRIYEQCLVGRPELFPAH